MKESVSWYLEVFQLNSITLLYLTQLVWSVQDCIDYISNFNSSLEIMKQSQRKC